MLWIKFIDISLKLLVGHTTFLTKSILVQAMAWNLQATNHYLSQCWPRPLSPYGVTRLPWVNQDKDGRTGGDEDIWVNVWFKKQKRVWSKILMLKISELMMHGINEVIFASRKYITYIYMNFTELESLDFLIILRQNHNTWRIFQAWNAIMSNLMTFCIPRQLEIILWVKMLVYTLRTSCFYEWKLWYYIIFKIPTRNSLTFPWHLPLFRISLTLSQIPWQFPDLE